MNFLGNSRKFPGTSPKDFFTEWADFLHPCLLVGVRIQTDPNAFDLNVRACTCSADVWCIGIARAHTRIFLLQIEKSKNIQFYFYITLHVSISYAFSII